MNVRMVALSDGFMPPASRAPFNFRLIPRACVLGYYMSPPAGACP
jgi:hypothetical protein